ncbi:MAG: alpha/beta hydrolase [Myxococcales bacterium]|nr:alpha/beta hydrolase [Myxococcales bacterium]
MCARRSSLLALFWLGSVLAACESSVTKETSPDGGGGAEQADGGGGAAPAAPSITWAACAPDDAPGFECADVPVPIDWGSLDGPEMTVRLRRKPAATDPPRGAAWMLEGGPGAPGAWMLTFAERTAAEHPDLDVMIVDHRGTGHSGELACATATDPPTLDCLSSLEQTSGTSIAATSTSASAQDVAALARWFGRGETQLLYGRSYGTYWAHRTVTLAPEGFDAVVLDSPCDAVEGCPSWRRDHDIDLVGRAFFALCDQDPACAARLPGGAVSFVEATVASADAGACAGAAAAGLTGVRLRLALARLLGTSEGRALAPAIVFRYARCSAADEAALANAAAWLDTLEELFAAVPGLSLPTNYQVMRTEFWGGSHSVAEAEAQLASTIVASGASVRWAKAFESWPWPVFHVDPALHQWRLSDAPVLVLTGGLDTATPPALLGALPGALPPGSTLVEQSLAGHVASAVDTPTGECARALIDSFLDDPSATLDLGCVAQADQAERSALFQTDAETSMQWFGTPSAYD